MQSFKRFSPLPFIKQIYSSLYNYPVPSTISYFWNLGVLSLLFLFLQILSGLFLSMHYLATIDLAFSSVEYIMREVNFGWFLRYLHSNGASMFSVVVFSHIARGLFYSSFCYPRELLWVVGVSIFSLMIVIAFLGYVLPWGQMSFWGATVITNLLSAIPFWGEDIVVWLWVELLG